MVLKVRSLLHISTIRKNPNGLKYRFQAIDDYVAAQGYRKVKNYEDFIFNHT